MTRGVRLYLVGSFVLVSLAGCGRGFFSAEREPWRAEAEIACLKSGAVKETAELVRIEPDFGPRRLRRGVSAQGRRARRKQRQPSVLPTMTCGRPPISAISRAGRSRQPPPALALFGYRHPPARLRRRARRPDFIDRARASRPRRTKSICRPRARPGCGTGRARTVFGDAGLSARATALGALSGAPRCRPGSAAGGAAAAARACAGQFRRRVRTGGGETGGDAGLSDRLGARSLARRIPCSRPRSAGSARASSRSGRSPPIPAAA